MRNHLSWMLCCLAIAGSAQAQSPSNSAAGPATDTSAQLMVHLACDGTGTYSADDGSARVVSTQVFVDLEKGGGRIKLPTVMIPPIHGGPADSWRAFDSISISDDAVRAKFTLNFLNKPRVNLDRQTGHMDMTGLGLTFNGACHPYSGDKVF